MRWFVVVAVLAISFSAQAQQPQQKSDLMTQGLGLAVQQLGVTATMYIEETRRQLAEKDAQIVELKRLCGEPCKPIAEAK